MSRWRQEEGWTLIELMIAAALMLLVASATLNVLDTITQVSHKTEGTSETVDRARMAMDAMARQLRNATDYQTATNGSTSAILRATSSDVVFKRVDPVGSPSSGNANAVATLRYCLNTATNVLYSQQHADAVLPASTCPDTSWAANSIATGVVNGSRPLFVYDATAPSNITAVGIQLYVNADQTNPADQRSLSSGLFLRNQNQPPTASFTVTPEPNEHVELDGSFSADREGQLLTYQWMDGSTVLAQTGPVVDYVAPSTGSHTFTLTVTDAGGLTATTSQTVTIQ